jgi:hypothetical protein
MTISFHHRKTEFQQINSFMTETVTSAEPTQSWGFVKTQPKYLDLFGLKIPIGKMPGLESGSCGLVCVIPTSLKVAGESYSKSLCIRLIWLIIHKTTQNGRAT